jgi:hypothetical protein
MTCLDVESAEDFIIDQLKKGLNDQISLINTEKADDITLEPIPIDQYYQTWTEEINNTNLFLFYYLSNILSSGIGPATTEGLNLVIAIFDNNDLNTLNDTWKRKSLRYGRAVKQTIHKRFADHGSFKMEVRQALPETFQLNENSTLYKVAGLELTATFG